MGGASGEAPPVMAGLSSISVNGLGPPGASLIMSGDSSMYSLSIGQSRQDQEGDCKLHFASCCRMDQGYA